MSKRPTKAEITDDLKLFAILIKEAPSTALQLVVQKPWLATQRFPKLASPDSDFSSGTPLGMACAHHESLVAHALIDLGAPVNAPMKDGSTPLHQAMSDMTTKQKRRGCIMMLLTHGARVDLVDHSGAGVLAQAMFNNVEPELMQLLVDRGAPVNTLRSDGALHINDFGSILGRQDRRESMAIAVRAGMKMTAGTGEFSSLPLFNALMHEEYELATLMLEHGADPRAQNFRGDTMLTSLPNERQIQWLLNAAPDLVHLENRNGQTPLAVLLAKYLETEKAGQVIRDQGARCMQLIGAGSDLNAVDYYGPGVNPSPRKMMCMIKSPSMCEIFLPVLARDEALRAIDEMLEPSHLAMQP